MDLYERQWNKHNLFWVPHICVLENYTTNPGSKLITKYVSQTFFKIRCVSSVTPAVLRTPAVGCSVPVTAATHQQAFICLHSPCRATPFIPVNLEHQTGTFSYCVLPVPSLVLTAMTNGWVDTGSAGSEEPQLPAERPLIRKSKVYLTLL